MKLDLLKKGERGGFQLNASQAVLLGLSIAWATTRGFHLDFSTGLLLGVAVAIGLFSQTYPWVRYTTPLFIGLGWYVQTWMWAWEPFWPMLILSLLLVSDAQTVLSLSPKITPRRLRLLTYTIVLLAVMLGGIPVWCLLALFTLPLIWQDTSQDTLSHQHLPFLITLFITVGYLIKGLIR